jgi:hypothetical protein
MSPTQFGNLTDVSRSLTWYLLNRYPTAAKAAPRVNRFPSHKTAKFSALVGNCKPSRLERLQRWPSNYRSPRFRENSEMEGRIRPKFSLSLVLGKAFED